MPSRRDVAIHAVCTTLAGAGDRIVERELYGGRTACSPRCCRDNGSRRRGRPARFGGGEAFSRRAAMFYVETIANPSALWPTSKRWR